MESDRKRDNKVQAFQEEEGGLTLAGVILQKLKTEKFTGFDFTVQDPYTGNPVKIIPSAKSHSV